ncbi:MAG TPA: FAD-dependent oxidoreductase [Luteolibacter sp.]|nr:FAD-dependent oxidoreductase [Luteolibacter sp.]
MRNLIVACLWLGVTAVGQAEFVPPTLAVEKWAPEYDVVIAGAGTGGCGAAIQAARMGAKVLLLDETDYIGGQMNAAAVTSMDEGGTSVRDRGLYKELVERIEAHYAKSGINAETAYWFGHICVEPRVGREILHQMLDEAKVDVSLRSKVVKVLKEDDRVTGSEIEVTGDAGKVSKTVRSKFLVDATEWGDVLPLAGVKYRAGNTMSPNIDGTKSIQMITWTAVVRKYADGVPDAFKFKQAPPGYTPKIEQYFKDTLKDGDDMGLTGRERPWTWHKFIGYRGMPDSKMPPQRVITRTHLNFNNDYPTTAADIEDPVQRQKTERAAALKTLQLMYYIQTTLGKSDWGIADDEGYDTPYNRARVDAWLKDQPELEPFRTMLINFPVMAYARESRRMVGEYTLKARDIERVKGKPELFPDCIAVGDYAVDLHGSMTPKYLELDLDREEDIPEKHAFTTGPFAIPYGVLIPETVDGFLPAEKNFSQSKMGNGATRLQPHTMLIGQAVGATAALSVKYEVQPRYLSRQMVQMALLEAGSILFYPPIKDLSPESPEWKAVQLLTTNGVMTVEDGKFRPKEPVLGEDMNNLQLAIMPVPSGLQMYDKAARITREAFSRLLSRAAGRMQMKDYAHADVEVNFQSSKEEGEQLITRSEAAQVMAEFAKAVQLARLTKTRQVFEWTSVLPASEPTSYAGPALRKALGQLMKAEIITAEDYWLKNAGEGGECDGKLVGIVIRKAAEKLSPGDKRPPVEILVEKRVVTSVDYWSKRAQEGVTCDGKNVQQLLRGLARHF